MQALAGCAIFVAMKRKAFAGVFLQGWLLLLAAAIPGPSMAQLFQHGVASGDPVQHGFIIWTRLSPPGQQPLRVDYYVAEDSSFGRIVRHGQVLTSPGEDFTVKADISGLKPDTYYFYRFVVGDETSAIGRSRTLPAGSPAHLRLAIMSCSNYEDGYFHAYRHVAHQKDLNAIVHLGDYIYESYYTIKRKTRDHLPARELFELEDYRQRYAQYRLDTNLQEAHRLHPFITVWDDHEASNNANHYGSISNDSTQHNWHRRVQAAKRAYFEWMPIRHLPGDKIYREISFGKLADLFMLDTRLEGRDRQIYDATDARLAAPSRSMLGTAQRQWLLSGLKQSTARWKLIGNQVLFSPLYGKHIHSRVEDRLLDIWDGYPAERLLITRFLRQQQIPNVVFLTGDFHTSLVFEVPVDDWNYPLTPGGCDYNPQTGENAVAVEFVTPSITSQNFDEFALYLLPFRPFGHIVARYIEKRFRKPSKRDKSMPGNRRMINPHLKWVNLRAHGYVLLQLSPQRLLADYYLFKRPWKEQARLRLSRRFEVRDGQARVFPLPQAGE
ncbi:MAG: hypothetical protein D6730_07475 [Bacteroidetes bacterium]|nr:MAG: hypothetical protein D6730_07475 [Bacteroidota bacterium]